MTRDPAAELAAARLSCALLDLGHLSRVLARGPDALDLLHRLSTKAVAGLAEGEGRPTVLTTNKGRIVARLFVHHLGDEGVLLVGGEGDAPRAVDHLDRFTFAEETGLEDVSSARCHLGLIGPRAADALRGLDLPVPSPCGAARGRVAEIDVRVLGEDGYSTAGYSVMVEADAAEPLRAAAAAAVERVGGRTAGGGVREAWRILSGLGAAGHELTEDHNPLEAGLRDAVDFDKGCYVGQEVVARLNTYDKVARAIRVFVLPAGSPLPAIGTPLRAGERPVGEVTSAVAVPGSGSVAALAYVKRGHFDAGTKLTLGDGDGPTVTLREPPLAEVP